VSCGDRGDTARAAGDIGVSDVSGLHQSSRTVALC